MQDNDADASIEEITDWFEEYENYVNHTLWSTTSTWFNTYGRFWMDMLNSTLHPAQLPGKNVQTVKQ